MMISDQPWPMLEWKDCCWAFQEYMLTKEANMLGAEGIPTFLVMLERCCASQEVVVPLEKVGLSFLPPTMYTPCTCSQVSNFPVNRE
jgi:hypothetical protein